MSVQHDWKKRLADELRQPENDQPPLSATELGWLWALVGLLAASLGLLGILGGP